MDNNKIPENRIFDMDALIPGLSVDCVIIGFEENELKILTLKLKSKDERWALPGGFVFKDEDLNKAAIRVLNERTGIKLPFLEQFHTFGAVGRRDRETLEMHLKSYGIQGEMMKWFTQRFISAGYVSLIDIQECNLKPDFASERIEWVSLKKLPQLVFDHNHIVDSALDYIRNLIHYLPIGITLLPEKFTMKQLQYLYEAILQKKLDRGNFQRKMLKLGIFIRHEKKLEGKANKAPYLYSIDKEKYEKLLEKGYGFAS